ncbi:monovalent cation/H(+) antiporter subunit G [Xanthobacter sp. DSM 24535]|uniref:cation:proton antiporter n=1 Tax=Roseixanthobacter psychrophilus TaxID=3119917 RepID=UPI00372B2B90
MSAARDVFTLALLLAGTGFFLAGTLGLLRFPDSLTRLHALTKADNVGLALIVLALLPQAASLLDAAKMLAVWALVQIASGTVAQMLARAARSDDETPNRTPQADTAAEGASP